MIREQSILLVEDNDDDAELTLRALKLANLHNPVVRVHDGVEALAYLHGDALVDEPPAQDLPAVVLLDLRLPRLDGIDVLRVIRAHERTSHLPVVILTSSQEDRDRLAAYDNHANSYVAKPVDYDQFLAAARDLGLYWIVHNLGSPKGRT